MQRNKANSIVLAGIVVLLILYQFVCLPNLKKIREITKTYQQKQNDLKTLNEMISQYKEKTKKENPIFAPPEFNLYLFISRLIETTDLKSRISRITPVSENILFNTKEQHISLTIEEIELAKLLEFLEEIEKKDFLRYGY
ncbi:MAG: type II secretion system protein GspM, partial [Candidatus Omnitrophica bacterium]|nr:type II secretion system protein GspM [Candidatus Omnitrophota bacterium]